MTDGLTTPGHAVASEPCHGRAHQALSRVAAMMDDARVVDAELCRVFGVSRQRGYVWLRRFREAGFDARPRGPVEMSTYESHRDLRADAGHQDRKSTRLNSSHS